MPVYPGPDELCGLPGKQLTWLSAIAIAVDGLLQRPGAVLHFEEMLRQWWLENKEGRRPVVDFPLARALSHPEKYAVVAAVHYLTCEDPSKRIDLWRIGPKRKKNVVRLI